MPLAAPVRAGAGPSPPRRALGSRSRRCRDSGRSGDRAAGRGGRPRHGSGTRAERALRGGLPLRGRRCSAHPRRWSVRGGVDRRTLPAARIGRISSRSERSRAAGFGPRREPPTGHGRGTGAPGAGPSPPRPGRARRQPSLRSGTLPMAQRARHAGRQLRRTVRRLGQREGRSARSNSPLRNPRLRSGCARLGSRPRRRGPGSRAGAAPRDATSRVRARGGQTRWFERRFNEIRLDRSGLRPLRLRLITRSISFSCVSVRAPAGPAPFDRLRALRAQPRSAGPRESSSCCKRS